MVFILSAPSCMAPLEESTWESSAEAWREPPLTDAQYDRERDLLLKKKDRK